MSDRNGSSLTTLIDPPLRKILVEIARQENKAAGAQQPPKNNWREVKKTETETPSHNLTQAGSRWFLTEDRRSAGQARAGPGVTRGAPLSEVWHTRADALMVPNKAEEVMEQEPKSAEGRYSANGTETKYTDLAGTHDDYGWNQQRHLVW